VLLNGGEKSALRLLRLLAEKRAAPKPPPPQRCCGIAAPISSSSLLLAKLGAALLCRRSERRRARQVVGQHVEDIGELVWFGVADDDRLPRRKRVSWLHARRPNAGQLQEHGEAER